MKKISFLLREGNPWINGGSSMLLSSYREGLAQHGVEMELTSSVEACTKNDLVVIEDGTWPINGAARWLGLMNIPYIVHPYCHDNIHYARYLRGQYAFLLPLIEGAAPPNHHLETLLECPEIVNYSSYFPDAKILDNWPAIKDALFCLTSDPAETEIAKRYFPSARVHHNFLSPGNATDFSDFDDLFLIRTGLQAKEYMVQLGRIEMRKNQLTTVMATRNFKEPLIFIEYNNIVHHPPYCESVVQAAIKYRKGPTFFFSNRLKPRKVGNVEVIPIDAPFTQAEILSAIGNAGIFIQPAFIELPGYVFLEAAKLGVPTVASKWCTVNEYFKENGTYTLDERITYPLPYHINAVEQAVKDLFGKTFPKSDHPIFKRTHADMAGDFLKLCEKFLALQPPM